MLDRAKREVFSEVGIDVKDVDLTAVAEEINTGQDFQLVEIGYKCTK